MIDVGVGPSVLLVLESVKLSLEVDDSVDDSVLSVVESVVVSESCARTNDKLISSQVKIENMFSFIFVQNEWGKVVAISGGASSRQD